MEVGATISGIPRYLSPELTVLNNVEFVAPPENTDNGEEDEKYETIEEYLIAHSITPHDASFFNLELFVPEENESFEECVNRVIGDTTLVARFQDSNENIFFITVSDSEEDEDS
jgi:hypothetical protein